MSLSVSGYVRQYYRGNLFGATESGRSGRTSGDLVSADAKAVKRALKELHNFDYDEGDGAELWNKVQAYVNTYNNFIDSAKEMDDDSISRYASKLKKLANEQKDKLTDIGVTIQGSGRLKVDKTALMETSRYKVSKVFSEDAEYGEESDKLITKMNNMIRRKGLNIPVPAADKQPSGSIKNDTASTAGVQAQDAAADAQLFQQLTKALEGSRINYSV